MNASPNGGVIELVWAFVNIFAGLVALAYLAMGKAKHVPSREKPFLAVGFLILVIGQTLTILTAFGDHPVAVWSTALIGYAVIVLGWLLGKRTSKSVNN